MFYATGLIISTGHFNSYGIAEFDLVSIQYILIGAAYYFYIFSALIFSISFGLIVSNPHEIFLKKENQPIEEEEKQKKVLYIFAAFASLTLAFFCFMLLYLGIIRTINRETIIPFFSVFVLGAAMLFIEQKATSEDTKSNEPEFSIFSALGLFYVVFFIMLNFGLISIYTSNIYPLMPASSGGSINTPIKLVFEKKEEVLDNIELENQQSLLTKNYSLIKETSDSYYLLNDKKQVMQVPKRNIKGYYIQSKL